jgi:Subtilase family
MRYAPPIVGGWRTGTRGGHVGWVVGLALLWVLAAPQGAHAETCSNKISGPNDPGFAEAERKFPSAETWNSEDWPLFDCIPQTASKATDPEGAAGMSVNRAWANYGMGHVIVAYMEGGVNWKLGDSNDLREQAYLNTGELPYPQDKAGKTHGTYNLYPDNGAPGDTGAVDVRDYEEDPRVGRANPQAGGITPEDLIIAFGHCKIEAHEVVGSFPCPASGSYDNDHNGYPNDISGWNFHRDTNDPQTDNTVYHHANGESERLLATANNKFGGVGVCPGCRLLTVKMGDEAIDRPDRVAEAIVFAVNSGAKVIDVTDATLGQTPSMLGAVEYAYKHGAVIAWASNDFESADHTEGMRYPHVWPGNSVVSDESNREGQSMPGDLNATTFRSRSTLTSYGAHALFSVSTGDGSTSTAIPTTAGVAALVSSAGQDAASEKLISEPLSANEVFQVTRAATSRIDETPCTNCFPGLKGAEWNIQYGYGRPNVYEAMKAVHEGDIPPEASIAGPEWYSEVDPTQQTTETLSAEVSAKRSSAYAWKLQYSPSVEPLDGEWKTINSGTSSAPQTVSGSIKLSDIPEAFWAGSYEAPTEGRLSIERYDVSVRVVVEDASGRIGVDRRVFQLRHDPSEIAALHKNLGTSIESSPTLADIEGRGGLDVLVAGSDGTIHALRPDGSEAPGWPVHTSLARGVDAAYPYNYLSDAAWKSGEIPLPHEGIDAPLAVGDLFHDGRLEVVATGQDGHVYVWDRNGSLLPGFPVETDPKFRRMSVPPEEANYVRHPSTGNVGGAALGDLEKTGQLDIVIGGWDGHMYAWRPNGEPVPGWPVSTDPPTPLPEPGACEKGKCTYARDYKIATTPVLVDINGSGRKDVVVAVQDTEFGKEPNGSPVYGFVEGYSSEGNKHPGGARLPHFPVAIEALAQGYGTAQDFITEGVQTPVSFEGATGPQLVANPGLFTSQTIDLRTGTMVKESPGSIPASPENPLNGASSLVHFTTTASIGKLTAGALTAVQASSSSTDVVTGVVKTPGKGIRVRSAVEAWNPESGANLAQYTQPLQGLAFLSAPALADVTGEGKPDIILGADSSALQAWDGTSGKPLSGWPKWTGGWSLFTPAIGDLLGNGHNTVVVGLREGWLHAYATPGLASANNDAWHWHQNDRNTGHYGDDTRPPMIPGALHQQGSNVCWIAPGGDWNVGTAASYDLRTFKRQPTPETFASKGKPLAGAPAPAPAGTSQCAPVPLTRARAIWVGLRAIDAAGNISYPAFVRVRKQRHH